MIFYFKKKQQQEKELIEGGENITLIIQGMTCKSCAETIENKLKLTQGIINAVVNFETKLATINFKRDLIGILFFFLKSSILLNLKKI